MLALYFYASAEILITGLFYQDVYTIPGFDKVFNGASMMKLHNLAVEQGAMQQLLLWLSLLEIISGVPAIIQVFFFLIW